MEKKSIQVGPSFNIDKANWSEEYDKLSAEHLINRNVDILRGLVSGDEIKSMQLINSDSDSWILTVPSDVEENIMKKILSRGFSKESMKEIMACMFALYQETLTGPKITIDSLGALTGIGKEAKGVNLTTGNQRLYGDNVKLIRNTMIVDPDTGRPLKGHHIKDGKDHFFPLTTMMEKYPDTGWDGMLPEIAESMACRLRDVEYLLEDIEKLGIEDHFPDIKHHPRNYIGYLDNKAIVLGEKMFEYIHPVTIDDKIVNPRHYAYNTDMKAVIWFGYEILKGNRPEVIRKDSVSDFLHAVGVPGSKAARIAELIMAVGSDEPIGQTIRVAGGYGIPMNYSESRCEQFIDERPETVKGNSRIKIIDNGKHKWPAAKTRKGHR